MRIFLCLSKKQKLAIHLPDRCNMRKEIQPALTRLYRSLGLRRADFVITTVAENHPFRIDLARAYNDQATAPDFSLYDTCLNGKQTHMRLRRLPLDTNSLAKVKDLPPDTYFALPSCNGSPRAVFFKDDQGRYTRYHDATIYTESIKLAHLETVAYILSREEALVQVKVIREYWGPPLQIPVSRVVE